jgi:hypothetical protein
MLVFANEAFDIFPINELFPSNPNIWKSAVPDLATPEPFGRTNITNELFDRKESFRGHILGTATFKHLKYLRIFWTIGLDIPLSR